MLTTLKTGLKCLLQGALVALAAVASAGEETPQVSNEVLLNPAQLRAVSTKGSLLDSSQSLLTFKAKPVDGTVMSPEPKLLDRMQLAVKQLADDTAYAAQARVNAAKGIVPPGELTGQRVVGTDERQRVGNTTAAPFKAICKLEMAFPKGSFVATAEFVHPRVLLTNSHCVYQSAQGGWAKSIKVIPGLNGNGTTPPFGSQYAATYYCPSEWVNGKENNRDFDMAWIILPDRTLFNRVGMTFGYQTTDDATLRSSKLNLSGYHGDKNGQQWTQYAGGNQTVYASQFIHYLDTTGGSSGSPMYLYYTNGQTRIVGVNCAESTGSSAYNVGTRMTSRYFNSTQNYSKQYP